MAAVYSHSPAELAALEDATGLRLCGYLDVDGVLLPILGTAGQAARWHHWRRKVLAMNGRAQVEPAQVEAPPPAA